MLVGQENAGWRLITTQLNHERVMLRASRKIAGLYDRVHAWASSPARMASCPSIATMCGARSADQGDLADQRTAQLAGRRRR